MVDEQHLQLARRIGNGKRIDAALVLRGRHRTGEHRIHAAVLIGVDHVLVVGIEGNGDFLHLGLGLPPGGVGVEKHVAGRLKAADDIGTRAHGVGHFHLGGRHHGEGHAVKQAVIIARGLDHHGAVILRGEGGHHIADVAVKAAVQALVVLGQVQDILPAGYHVLRGERRAVRKGDVLAQGECPGLAPAALGPAFGQQGLRQAVVVHGDQAFIHHAIQGHNIALLRREGTNLRGAGGNHAHNERVLDVFAEGGQGHKHQTKQQAKNSFHASSSVAS